MKIIYARKGEEILVDDEDYEWLNRDSWRVNHDGYAIRKAPHPKNPGTNMTVFMHREVMGLKFGDRRVVDHVHHQNLDNRKSELRVCARSENQRNCRRAKNNTSGYKGVYWNASAYSWVATIRFNGKNRYLGTFRTPEDAHEFWCLAADMIYGDFANHGLEKADPRFRTTVPMTRGRYKTTRSQSESQRQAVVIAPLVKAALGE